MIHLKGKGVSRDASKAAEQMAAVQRAYGKDSQRRMYQMILSFPEDMRSKKSVKRAADQVADMLFADFQVYYGIHAETDHWHVHYAINAVSYRTGKKWHQSRSDLAAMKQKISSIIGRALHCP